jgi:hypothetical protein
MAQNFRCLCVHWGKYLSSPRRWSNVKMRKSFVMHWFYGGWPWPWLSCGSCHGIAPALVQCYVFFTIIISQFNLNHLNSVPDFRFRSCNMEVWWSVTCEKASSMLVIWSLRSQISNRWGDASGTDLTSFHLECGSVVHVDSIESIRYGSIHVTTTPNLGMIFTCIHIPTYSNLSPILLWATRIASQLQRCCKCATFWEFVAPANPT